jgi:hypothetical protein
MDQFDVQGSKDSIASLLGALKYDYKEEPSTVHRLDRDTSGALLIARTKTVARILSEVTVVNVDVLMFRHGGNTRSRNSIGRSLSES